MSCDSKTIKDVEKILKQINDLKQENDEKELALKRLEEDINPIQPAVATFVAPGL